MLNSALIAVDYLTSLGIEVLSQVIKTVNFAVQLVSVDIRQKKLNVVSKRLENINMG